MKQNYYWVIETKEQAGIAFNNLYTKALDELDMLAGHKLSTADVPFILQYNDNDKKWSAFSESSGCRTESTLDELAEMLGVGENDKCSVMSVDGHLIKQGEPYECAVFIQGKWIACDEDNYPLSPTHGAFTNQNEVKAFKTRYNMLRWVAEQEYIESINQSLHIPSNITSKDLTAFIHANEHLGKPLADAIRKEFKL